LICPHCGKEHPDQAIFCPETGKSLSSKPVCPYCGQSHPANAQFCPVSGKSLLAVVEPSRSSSIKKPRRIYTILLPVVILLFVTSGIAVAFVRRDISLDAMLFLEKIIPSAPPVASPFEATTLPAGEQNSAKDPTVTQDSPATASSPLVPTVTFEPTFTISPSPTSDLPFGKIVYTCQIFKNNNRNQICLINADGSEPRRLTTDDRANHFYPSLSPDGASIVFSSNQTGTHEIYETDLDGNQVQLTSLGELYAPEISPDGSSITFVRTGNSYSSIWIMDRNGDNPREIYKGDGVDVQDPTWSPNGEKILFAMGIGENKHLYTLNQDGTSLTIVNENFSTRGRSDWSWDGSLIAGYSGGSWQRKIFLMKSDGSNLIQLYSSGNVQAPSFSPDDHWLVFTGYIDNMRNDNGCEIYLLRTNGEDLSRLTTNDFCDWQPRWGP